MNKTGKKLKIVELARRQDPSTVSSSAGQLIIRDDGNMYYDNTEGSRVAISSGSGGSGSSDASNIFITDDIQLAGDYTSIGNYKIGTKITSGTSLQTILNNMLSKKLQPTEENITKPSVSIESFNSGAYEVGTEVTPTYEVTFSAGIYPYGPDPTGVEVSSWTVVAKDGSTTIATKTATKGSFEKITVKEGTSYTITATAAHSAGAVAKDNLGGTSDPVIQIAAGSKSATSSAITGYRAWFYGYKGSDNELNVSNLTSANIRGLTASNGSIPKSITTNKMKQMFFAIPSACNKTKITVANSTNGAPQTVTKIENIMVKGANNYTEAAYDVWYVNNASAESGQSTFNITVS